MSEAIDLHPYAVTTPVTPLTVRVEGYGAPFALSLIVMPPTLGNSVVAPLAMRRLETQNAKSASQARPGDVVAGNNKTELMKCQVHMRDVLLGHF